MTHNNKNRPPWIASCELVELSPRDTSGRCRLFCCLHDLTHGLKESKHVIGHTSTVDMCVLLLVNIWKCLFPFDSMFPFQSREHLTSVERVHFDRTHGSCIWKSRGKKTLTCCQVSTVSFFFTLQLHLYSIKVMLFMMHISVQKWGDEFKSGIVWVVSHYCEEATASAALCSWMQLYLLNNQVQSSCPLWRQKLSLRNFWWQCSQQWSSLHRMGWTQQPKVSNARFSKSTRHILVWLCFSNCHRKVGNNIAQACRDVEKREAVWGNAFISRSNLWWVLLEKPLCKHQ